jgi:hypothetical protein
MPQAAKGQGVNEIYGLLCLRRRAGNWWRQCMTANPGCFALMYWAGRQADCMRWSIRLEGGATADFRWCHQNQVFGAVWPWRNSVRLNCALMDGAQGRAHQGKPASMKSISTRTLSPEAIHRKDSEAVAATAGAPEHCAVSRSNADYAARGVRGEPRGRKSGVVPGTTNPT